MKLGQRTIDVSNADKVLFPDAGFTKQDLAEYYRQAATLMMPHVKDRVISMERFPDGIGKGGFYEKKAPEHFPPWIGRVSVELEGGATQQQIAINEAPVLVYLADQACVTPHVWLSRTKQPKHPDILVFDLDPSGDDFALVVSAARMTHELLEELELPAYLQLTGSRGIHVVVPLDRKSTFNQAREFAADVATVLAERHPEELTTEQRKQNREGRVYLDVMRNTYGQTVVPPYAVRARAGAPVATPIDWDELRNSSLTPDKYNIKTLFKRMAQKDDPWSNMRRRAHSLRAPRRRLGKLKRETTG